MTAPQRQQPRTSRVLVIVATLVTCACAVLLGAVVIDPPSRGDRPHAAAGATSTTAGRAGDRDVEPGPGTLLETRQWTSAAGGVSGRWVRYLTADDSGRSLAASAVVFVPTGVPPQRGWQVVALGHGSVGINTGCGPSLTGNLAGMTAAVRRYLDRGMAVTVADYPGLGTSPGSHPYLDSYAAARSMIDSVRALRAVFPHVSSTWVVHGISQGGGAAWAAAEIAADYAPDLRLRGAVAQVPSTDKSYLVDKAVNGVLSVEQQGILQWLLESLSRGDDLDLDDLRTPALAAVWNDLSRCGGDPARELALQSVSASDFIPADRVVADRLRALLDPMSPPHGPNGSPMLILYGGDDRFLDRGGIEESIRSACTWGSSITVDYQPAAGHLTIDTTSIWPFVQQVLHGEPVPNDCSEW